MPVPGVEVTAVAMAYLREIESARPDALFDDPWARAFVDASGERRPDVSRTSAGRGGPGAADWVTVRTRFIDDAVRAAGLRQAVLLGAGLDSPVRPGTTARGYGREPVPEDADHLPARRHLIDAHRT